MVDGVRLVLKPTAEPELEARIDLARLPVTMRVDRSQSNEGPSPPVSVSIDRARLIERSGGPARISVDRARPSDVYDVPMQVSLNKGESIVMRTSIGGSGRAIRFVKRR